MTKLVFLRLVPDGFVGNGTFGDFRWQNASNGIAMDLRIIMLIQGRWGSERLLAGIAQESLSILGLVSHILINFEDSFMIFFTPSCFLGSDIGLVAIKIFIALLSSMSDTSGMCVLFQTCLPN